VGSCQRTPALWTARPGWTDRPAESIAYRDRVADRPYVLVSAAVSLDGALDDRTDRRLILSGPEDLDAVDELRASCDAILVGAGTVRADNPRLLVRSPARRAARAARGLSPTPTRVVLSSRGDLDPDAAVFAGGPPPLVLGGDLAGVFAELAGRGVGRLLVEGGARVLTAVLAAGLADELRLAVAPVFVGDPDAPRLLGPPGPAGSAGLHGLAGSAGLHGLAGSAGLPGPAGSAASTELRRARLLAVSAVGDSAVLRYGF
jgi:5-amino-6-(5-phosphoribosylamino)uracil reductase